MIEKKEITVKAGDAFLCRNGHRIATFKRDILRGERITVEDLLWRNGEPKKSARVFCPACNAPITLMAKATYKIHAQVQTADGRDPEKVPQIFEADEPVYILGTGASLDNFKHDLLEGRQVIATDKAIFACKNATIAFFCDPRFFAAHRDLSGQDFHRFKGRHIFTTAEIELHPRSRVQRLALREAAFSTDPAFIAAPGGLAKNAAWQAINLAYLAGARKIVLLGYDCESERHRAEFEDMATAIKRRKLKLEIVNANMASSLTCWPKCPRDEALIA